MREIWETLVKCIHKQRRVDPTDSFAGEYYMNRND